MTEPSMCGGDAALCQITFDHLFKFSRKLVRSSEAILSQNNVGDNSGPKVVAC